MPGDHQFLIRGDHPGGSTAVCRADTPAAGGASGRIGGGIEYYPEPSSGLADSFADRRGMLADAGGEDQRVEPTQRGGE